MSKRLNLKVNAEDVAVFLKFCKALGISPSHAATLALNSYVTQLQKMAEVVNLVVKDE